MRGESGAGTSERVPAGAADTLGRGRAPRAGEEHGGTPRPARPGTPRPPRGRARLPAWRHARPRGRAFSPAAAVEAGLRGEFRQGGRAGADNAGGAVSERSRGSPGGRRVSGRQQ